MKARTTLTPTVRAQSIPSQITTPDSVETRRGTLQFRDGMPDQETAAKLYDELDYIHAADTFLNGIAAVNMWALRKGFIDAGVTLALVRVARDR
jgi:hypothetical protein